jgi:hypothetical protein
MQRPHVWGRLVITIFTLKKEVISFGGTLAGLEEELPPSPTWTMAFGGLDVTLLAHDIILGLDVLMEEV